MAAESCGARGRPGVERGIDRVGHIQYSNGAHQARPLAPATARGACLAGEREARPETEGRACSDAACSTTSRPAGPRLSGSWGLASAEVDDHHPSLVALEDGCPRLRWKASAITSTR